MEGQMIERLSDGRVTKHDDIAMLGRADTEPEAVLPLAQCDDTPAELCARVAELEDKVDIISESIRQLEEHFLNVRDAHGRDIGHLAGDEEKQVKAMKGLSMLVAALSIATVLSLLCALRII